MRNEREKGKWEEEEERDIENILITREFRGRIWKPLVVMDCWHNQRDLTHNFFGYFFAPYLGGW